jgi:mannosyltransferase OCH1-like enzyme
MIPKLIHQIWVGPYQMPARERRFVEGIKRGHPDYAHTLWTNANLPALPAAVQERLAHFERDQSYAFQADILRAWLVHEYGGFYLDIDFEFITGIRSDITDYTAFFHGNLGDDSSLSNGFFGAEAKHPILTFMVNAITPERGWYGPHWVAEMIRDKYGLLRSTPHDEVARIVAADRVLYTRSPLVEGDRLRHHSLYSWSTENKARFARGEML